MKTIAIALLVGLLDFAALAQTNYLTSAEGQHRFGGLVLRDISFTQAPFSNVLAEVNRQLAPTGITVRLDFTPTAYHIPTGDPRIAQEATRLVKNRTTRSRLWTDSLDEMRDAPLLTWRAEKVNLLDFLREGLQVCGFVMALRFESDAILLAPGPSLEECRVYRFGTNTVSRLRQIGDGKITVEAFVDRASWQTNYMDWIDDRSLLLKIDTPEKLDEFQGLIDAIGDAERVPMEMRECTTKPCTPTN